MTLAHGGGGSGCAGGARRPEPDPVAGVWARVSPSLLRPPRLSSGVWLVEPGWRSEAWSPRRLRWRRCRPKCGRSWRSWSWSSRRGTSHRRDMKRKGQNSCLLTSHRHKKLIHQYRKNTETKHLLHLQLQLLLLLSIIEVDLGEPGMNDTDQISTQKQFKLHWQSIKNRKWLCPCQPKGGPRLSSLLRMPAHHLTRLRPLRMRAL